MDLNEKVAGFIELFEGDSLWMHINTLGIEKVILEDSKFLNQIVWGVDYSTSQATTILNVGKKQDILNLLNRHDLKDYLKVTQSVNKYYSFTHYSLFQLKMIFVLRDQGLQPLDIATIIGTITQYSRGEKRNSVSSNSEGNSVSKDEIEKIVQSRIQETLEGMLPKINDEFEKQKAHYGNSLNELKLENALGQWELKMLGIVNQIELLENQKKIIKSKSKTKSNLITKLLGIYPEENDVQISKLEQDIDLRLGVLLKEKNGLSVNKEKLLLEEKRLKNINVPAKLMETDKI